MRKQTKPKKYGKIVLGKYSLPTKGSRKLSPALAAKFTQAGELSFALRWYFGKL